MYAHANHSRYVDDHAEPGERTTALWMHIASYAYLLSFPAFLVPLVLWLVKRDDSPFLDDHGKEALNFHISLVLYILISFPLILALGFGFLMLFLIIPVCFLVFPALAAAAASRGEYYRYPALFRFLR